MKRISFRDIGLKYVLSPYDEPVTSVRPGEAIVLEVEDACSGQIRAKGDFRDRSKIPFSNPVVGPIYVEGAESGSAISISIQEIKPTTGQGVTYMWEGYLAGYPVFQFFHTGFPREPRICAIKGGSIHFSDRITIPYRPMVGTIGVAPHPGAEAISSGVLPGRHGGNMDVPEVSPGSKVLLPVFHRGALLYLGDVHAAQGDGEIGGSGIEMPADVKISVDLVEETLNWPRIETDSEVMSVATTSAGRSFEDTIRTAFVELSLWMERKHGLNRVDALMLCSQVGRIRVGNLWTVAARIEKKYC